MENYSIHQRLGKGAQASVYLVEHKAEHKKYVLKKIECADESEANKAFKEAMALQKLQHRFICGYREFFVTWDREESAMFVCIVMDYYKLGDLDRALKEKRKKSSGIEELIIKKWFGQMVEALAFVHGKQVIHRDLKPSNIFMTEDLNISIGDFGVSTVLEDNKAKAKTTVGSMNWMAPEVLERPYDERSDIWSLGCIVLEMTTCDFMDAATMAAKLFEIKSNPQELENVLEMVGQTYGVSLLQVIRTMLRRQYQQRPSTVELLELPYVQECLAINKSPLCKNKPESISRESSALNGSAVPKKKGINAVLTFMKDNEDDPDSQRDALIALKDLVLKHAKTINENGRLYIATLMRKHISKEDVQTSACRLLATLANEAEVGDVLFTQRMISPVALAMKSHPGSNKLQAAATELLVALSADEIAAKEIGRLGGVQDILAALRAFPYNVEIVANCCLALWSLAIDEENSKIVSAERGLLDIISAMNRYSDQPTLIEAASAALWSLSMEDGNLDLISNANAMSCLMQAIINHKKEAKIVKNAYMAIASIVEADESCAYEVLSGVDGTAGSTILIQGFEEHKDNEDVVENFSFCVAALAEYDDLKSELNHKNVGEILRDLKLKFADNQNVTDQINGALVALGDSKERSTHTFNNNNVN